MLKIKQGSLSMDNQDLENIRKLTEDGYTPKEALTIELEKNGLNIKDVYSVELNSLQLKNKGYVDIYSKLICDFWNN